MEKERQLSNEGVPDDTNMPDVVTGNPRDNQEEEPNSEGEESNEIDYKAELEKLQSVHSKTVAALKEKKEKLKEFKSKEVDESTIVETDGNPLNPTELDKLLETKLTKIEKQRVADDVEEVLDNLTSNEDERELIKAIYQDKLVPSGYTLRAIKKDLQDAQLIANRGRYVAKAKSEARRELAEQQAVKQAASPGAGRPQSVKSSKLTGEDRQFMDQWTRNLKIAKGEIKL